MKLYDSQVSANTYKVRLLCNHLGLDPERVEVDLSDGSSRDAELVERTPEGKVPTLVTDDGFVLPESGAILWYLARGSPFVPDDAEGEARVLQWLFFEQNQVECSIAVLRAYRHFGAPENVLAAGEVILRPKGEAALATLDAHLADRAFLLGDVYTVADLANYAYVHVADEGGFGLARYPNVEAWIGRVEAQPGFVGMDLSFDA